ncbi:piggyBac transposable element-derived protein 4-like [Ischnura elegans]|uniref:piggyBac transposable element-derived protein 4-like n=1 Tax=Ischnura elegans TaxID=197161 RepID=UPI001ED8885D|nr:piggyBac transposable element-derived protein 4-like [Ischnura elegans]
MTYLRSERDIETALLLSSGLSEEEEFDSDTEFSSASAQESEHDTCSDQDISDSETEYTTVTNDNFLTGKDRVTKWSTSEPRRNVRTPVHNIVSQAAGFKGNKNDINSLLDCFDIIFDENICHIIVNSTNIKLAEKAQNYSRERDAKPTDESEIRCLIGLLFYLGANKSGRQNLKDMWDQDGLGVEIFRASMNYQRFKLLLQCLRFDDIRDRENRRKTDKLAPIRKVFEMFIRKFEQLYNIGEFATVDKQLVPFRDRCSFRQYLPNKPAKYGIKIFALVDATVYYTQKMEVYLGIQPDGPFRVDNSPKEVVKRIVSPILGTGRNITVDNWFMSVPLLEDLLLRKLTIVGTIRKNKAELPLEIVFVKNRDEYSSIFLFRKNMTLMSYIPKKKKNVLMISSMHSDISIDPTTGEKKKPEMISFYNSTKGGVDTVDEMCATYSVARNTRRWPMVVFYHLMNTLGINAFVIFRNLHPEIKTNRRTFLREIAKGLTKPFIAQRSTQKILPKEFRKTLEKYGEPSISEPQEKRRRGSGRCVICPRAKDIKTKLFCEICERNMCASHMLKVCSECLENIKK